MGGSLLFQEMVFSSFFKFLVILIEHRCFAWFQI